MEPLPPNMVAQTDMTRSTAKGSICTHFVPLFWLLVSYWQRSIDSGELPLGIALEFWFWLVAATPSYTPPAPEAMAVLEA